MTRAELAALIAGKLSCTTMVAGRDALHAIVAPAVIVSPGGPYRVRTTVCWAAGVELTVVVARADNLNVYDRADEFVDELLLLLDSIANVSDVAVPNAPVIVPIGDIDHVTVTVTLNLY